MAAEVADRARHNSDGSLGLWSEPNACVPCGPDAVLHCCAASSRPVRRFIAALPTPTQLPDRDCRALFTAAARAARAPSPRGCRRRPSAAAMNSTRDTGWARPVRIMFWLHPGWLYLVQATSACRPPTGLLTLEGNRNRARSSIAVELRCRIGSGALAATCALICPPLIYGIWAPQQ